MLIFRIASSCHGVTIYGSFNFVCDWHDFLMFRQLTLNCTVAMLSTCIMQQQVWKCCYTVKTKKKMLMQNYSFIDMRWVMRYFAGAPPPPNTVPVMWR